MLIGPTHTKAEKQAVVKAEMHRFKHGELHSGSKHGPVVTNRKQAEAIAMKESHQDKTEHESKRERSEDKMEHREWKAAEKKSEHGYARSEHHEEHMKHHEKHGHKEEGHHDQEHEKQPHGEGLGIGMEDGAEHHTGHGMGKRMGPDFHLSKREADGFGHAKSNHEGHHRMSGHPQAHRVGAKRRG